MIYMEYLSWYSVYGAGNDNIGISINGKGKNVSVLNSTQIPDRFWC